MTLFASRKINRINMLCGTAVLVSACSTPYALNVQKVDLSQPQAQGSIMVSDAKLYRREALIKERNDEVAWLNDLIKASEKVEFQPELLREIEVIRSFSAGLGLSFDPAAGFNYRQGRALSAAQQQVALDRLAQGEELAAIKQEIALERLRFQLDQLKADLALARAKLADQKDPVNADLGKLGDVADPAAAGAVSAPTSGAAAAPGTGDIFTRLATSIGALQNRLDTESKAPRLAAAKANPIDEFRDRQAYRDVLRTARNAASLDDLHDSEGNKLVRLNFQATMLPPKDGNYARSYGLVDFDVEQRNISEEEKYQIYLKWLGRMNREYLTNDDLALTANQLRDVAEVFEYKIGGFKEENVTKYFRSFSSSFYNTVISLNRNLSLSNKNLPDRTGFGRPVISPRFVPSRDGAPRHLDDMLNDIRQISASGDQIDPKDAGRPDRSICKIATLRAYLSRRNSRVKIALNNKDQVAVSMLEAATYNSAFLYSRDILEQIRHENQNEVDRKNVEKNKILEKWKSMARLTKKQKIEKEADDKILAKIELDIRDPNSVISDINLIFDNINKINEEMFEIDGLIRNLCVTENREEVSDFAELRNNWRYVVGIWLPTRFDSALNMPERIAVYDVGPREQAQRLSTASRAADAVALALALSGNAPQAGINASAGIGFSRQATGKADALERVPQVVGYARAAGDVKPSLSQNAEGPRPAGFGWVLGPRAGIDPKGQNLTLNQSLKPYDLSVDLSLPAWWPSVKLRMRTFLSPDWARQEFSSWTSGLPGSRDEVDPAFKTVKVPLVVNAADLDALTDYLLGMRSTRSAAVDATYPRKIKACSATTLVALGRNLWRATGATLGGKAIGASHIAILPDMAGIEIRIDEKTVTKASVTKLESNGKDGAPLVILTPYGIASFDLEADTAECKDASASEKPPVTKVSVSSVFPSPLSLCSGGTELRLEGKDLDAVTEALLGGQTATPVTFDAKVKQLVLRFETLGLASRLKGKSQLRLNGANGKLLDYRIAVNNCPAK